VSDYFAEEDQASLDLASWFSGWFFTRRIANFIKHEIVTLARKINRYHHCYNNFGIRSMSF
jgi:hypothetical protein